VGNIKLTERLAEAGEMTVIDVLNHIIIGDEKYPPEKRGIVLRRRVRHE